MAKKARSASAVKSSRRSPSPSQKPAAGKCEARVRRAAVFGAVREMLGEVARENHAAHELAELQGVVNALAARLGRMVEHHRFLQAGARESLACALRGFDSAEADLRYLGGVAPELSDLTTSDLDEPAELLAFARGQVAAAGGAR